MVYLNGSHNAFTSLSRTYQLLHPSNRSLPPNLFAVGGAALHSSSPLQVLDVSYNQLSFLSFNILGGMTRLSQLQVSGNPMSAILPTDKIASTTLFPSALQALDLGGLGLNTIHPTALSQLIGLTSLDVSNNELTELPPISMLTDLSSLDAHSNHLRSCFLSPSVSLKSLNVSYNNLVTLFGNYSDVDSICSESGPEQSILSGYPLLEVLDISHNQIVGLERGAFDGLALPLERCFMHGNPLEYVSPPAREFLSNAVDVGFQDTPMSDLYRCGRGDLSCMGIFANAKAVFCSAIRGGEYCRPSLGLFLCPPGMMCFNDSMTPCAPGTFAELGAAVCAVCPDGSYTLTPAASSCQPCESGSFCVDGEKLECPEGTFSEKGWSQCSSCRPGTYSLSGAIACTVCEPGHKCENGVKTPCRKHTFASDGSATCEECPPGTYSGERAAACTTCEAGFACYSGKKKCPERFFSGSGAASCSPCPNGTYSLAPGSGVCTSCEAGYACLDGNREPCPSWTYSEPGWESCKVCTPGRYSEPRALRCKECEAGYACSDMDRRECPPGTFAPAGSGVCVTCPQGTYSSLPGSRDCVECEAGYACDKGLREKCPAQTFASAGASLCEACPYGTFSGAGAEFCSTCAVGYTVQRAGTNNSLARCEPCPAGRYYSVSSTQEAAVCVECAPGHFCQGTAQPETPCLPGYYSHGSASACTPCPAGRFANSSAPVSSDVCSQCPQGRFSDQPGSSTCALCPVGRHGVELSEEETPESMQAACAPCDSSEGYCGYGYSIPVSSAAYEADIAEYIATHPSMLGTTEAPKVASSVTHSAVAGSLELPFGLTYAALVFMAALLLGTMVILPLMCCRKRAQKALMKMDLFSLNRPVKPGDVVRSRPSFLGGVLSLTVLMAGIAILVNTGFDYFAETNVSRESAMTPIVGDLVAFTPSFELDIRVIFAENPEHGGCTYDRCDDFYLDTSDPQLGDPFCYEYGADALCTCRCTLAAADYSIPLTLAVMAEIPPDVNSVAWSLVTGGTEGAEYKLNSFATMQTPNGLASEWHIEFEALPEFVKNDIQDQESAGYMLFPSVSEYRGPFKSAVGAMEVISITWLGTVASLGRRSVISHRLTLLQALSASFGLLLAVLGGVRVGYKVLIMLGQAIGKHQRLMLCMKCFKDEAKKQQPKLVDKQGKGAMQVKKLDPLFSGPQAEHHVVLNPLHRSNASRSVHEGKLTD